MVVLMNGGKIETFPVECVFPFVVEREKFRVKIEISKLPCFYFN